MLHLLPRVTRSTARHTFTPAPRFPTLYRAMSSFPAWSRLVRFIAEEDGQEHLGEPVDSNIDVGTAPAGSVKVTKWQGSTPWDVTKSRETLTIQKVLCPLTKEQVNTIRCVGLNYSDHAKEAKLPLPTVITLFMKPRTALTGPGEVYVPKIAQDNSSDYESELCIVLGKDIRNASKEEALDAILGYTASNDISSRKAQFAQSQWCFSKSFDYACPIGPCLVSPKTFSREAGVVHPELTVTGKLNGKVMQSAPTENLVFSVAEIVSTLSQGTTLERGSIILTGE